MKIGARSVLAVLASLALALSACGGDDGGGGGESGGGESGGGEVTKVTFAQPLPKSIAFYPLFVGQELGYFEDEGFEVELTPAKDVSPIAVVPTGQADVGSTNPADLIMAKAKDVDVKVFYEYYQKNVFSIVVMEDSEFQELSQLKGKNIGITSESGGEAPIIRTALGEIGIDPEKDVKLISVGDGGPQVVNALKDGKVDAYVGAIQDLVALEAIGVPLRDITPANIADQPASSFFATSEWLEKLGPEKVSAFLRAWAKATYAGMKSPEKVIEMAKKHVPDEAGDDKFAKALFDVSMRLQTPAAGDEAFGQIRPDQWDTALGQLKEAGEVEGEVDMASLFDDQYLEGANDWDRAQVEQDIAGWNG